MEKSVKYFMLTSKAKDKTFANVYSSFSELKSDYHKFKDKFPMQTFLLTPVDSKEDIVIAKLGNQLIACLGPKKPVEGPNFIKCKVDEIKVK